MKKVAGSKEGSMLCYESSVSLHIILQLEAWHANLAMAQVLQQPGHCAGAFQQSQHLISVPRVGARTSDLATICARTDSSGAQLATSADGVGPLPTFDISPLLHLPPSDQNAGQAAWPAEVQQLCQAIAKCLHETGCLIIRDPRVNTEDNTAFLDMMERYFEQSTASKLQDSRPELHFQVGATPEGTELPKCICNEASLSAIQDQPPEHRARAPKGPDPKWRYMWRIGERPAETQFKELNAEPVIPAGFPEWPVVMTAWGNKMLEAVHTVAEMAAIGFNLPCDAFTERMAYGPHLLAPTGADLQQHHTLDMCYAGYHYDLNFMTIHGKSRFPGLYVWLRNGQRIPVQIPAGCLFLQAGKQLEWLTGGCVKAGMHEVVCSEATLSALESAKAQGRSTWRVSSTVFGHIASDWMLTPLGHFATPEACAAYPAIQAGQFVQQELEAIKLKL